MTGQNDISAEQSLIQDIFEPLTHLGHATSPPASLRSDVHFTKKRRKPLTFGLKDDCALAFVPEHKDLVISKDILIEGVHFIGTEKPSDIARKALRVNLSDLASGGAQPFGYMLGLCLGDKQTREYLTTFASGLKADQQSFNIPLLGGDLVSTSGPFTISITILGLADPNAYVSRDEAMLGDFIYVTGSVGDAALGLKLAQNLAGHNQEELPWLNELTPEDVEYLINRYHLPIPRSEIAEEIAQFCTAAMDISDGLMIDMKALCAASSVGADIDMSQVPVSKPITRLREQHQTVYDMILTGGDDYEILCTVPAKLGASFEQACKTKKCMVTQIGLITDGSCQFLTSEGQSYQPEIDGYSHIKKKD